MPSSPALATLRVFALLLLASAAACSTAPEEGSAAPASSEPAFVAPTIQLSEELAVREIRPGVHLVTHAFPWPANSLLVDMPDGRRLLVDTPYTPDATELLLSWADQTYGRRLTVAIVTGFHVDNLGGNAALVGRAIPIHGARKTAELVATEGARMREQAASWLRAPEMARYRAVHASADFVPPNRLYELGEGLLLDFGGEKVDVIFPGPTHTVDNVVVWFPERKLLFGGCMIVGGNKLGNTADADLASWPNAVRTLLGLGAETVVPGHGTRLDPGLLPHTIALLEPEAPDAS